MQRSCVICGRKPRTNETDFMYPNNQKEARKWQCFLNAHNVPVETLRKSCCVCNAHIAEEISRQQSQQQQQPGNNNSGNMYGQGKQSWRKNFQGNRPEFAMGLERQQQQQNTGHWYYNQSRGQQNPALQENRGRTESQSDGWAGPHPRGGGARRQVDRGGNVATQEPDPIRVSWSEKTELQQKPQPQPEGWYFNLPSRRYQCTSNSQNSCDLYGKQNCSCCCCCCCRSMGQQSCQVPNQNYSQMSLRKPQPLPSCQPCNNPVVRYGVDSQSKYERAQQQQQPQPQQQKRQPQQQRNSAIRSIPTTPCKIQDRQCDWCLLDVTSCISSETLTNRDLQAESKAYSSSIELNEVFNNLLPANAQVNVLVMSGATVPSYCERTTNVDKKGSATNTKICVMESNFTNEAATFPDIDETQMTIMRAPTSEPEAQKKSTNKESKKDEKNTDCTGDNCADVLLLGKIEHTTDEIPCNCELCASSSWPDIDTDSLLTRFPECYVTDSYFSDLDQPSTDIVKYNEFITEQKNRIQELELLIAQQNKLQKTIQSKVNALQCKSDGQTEEAGIPATSRKRRTSGSAVEKRHQQLRREEREKRLARERERKQKEMIQQADYEGILAKVDSNLQNLHKFKKKHSSSAPTKSVPNQSTLAY
ncbi:uncharacterized protein LOC115625243 [Scaptodrosophila lebanonensis]|uniref:Uncharacterized protein LOC115625243 n=1 Tax=Drosophila lebanonensis TaxID=7225 RepID=A0A6J2TJ89_DROLE|nr:uncharacterized protein LOC115625243 [Scaptodrosophila lebanonensis]